LGRKVDIIKASVYFNVAFYPLIGDGLRTLCIGSRVPAREIVKTQKGLRILALELGTNMVFASDDIHDYRSESGMDLDR
jgi:hypothetical protein